jgi:hypothetical protein
MPCNRLQKSVPLKSRGYAPIKSKKFHQSGGEIMTITPEEIEPAIQELITGKMPSRVKDGDQEVEFKIPSLQALTQALSNAKANQAGDDGGCWNLASFNDDY